MVSFEHKKLIEQIAQLSGCPEDEGDFEVWRAGLHHVDMLRRNARYENEEPVICRTSVGEVAGQDSRR